jgi:D-alanyl-D-alanine carboxypeptidase/D-alanyl-D-alanine-endopeptidase (penicillin-binding protein 4)
MAVILLLLGGVAVRAEEPSPADAAHQRLKGALRRAVARAAPARGKFGVHVARARTGETVFASDAEAPRIPASTMKLVTTAAAILELGFEYRFATEVVAAAEPGENGVVAGDLVVRGGGDPTLRSEVHPDRIAGQLYRAGLRRVRGALVMDDSVFDRVLRHPDWPADQLSRAYCAPVCGLSLDRGCVTVRVRPGDGPGARARVDMIPDPPGLGLSHEISTTSDRDRHRIVLSLDLAGSRIRGRGQVWDRSRGYETEVAVADPAECFGDLLARALLRSGIRIDGGVVRRPGPVRDLGSGRVLARIETELFPVVHAANRESENHYAECLLKLLGHVRTGEGSFEAGAAVTARLAERIGAPGAQLSQADGSGLSRSNRVSPYFLTRLLTHLYRSADAERFLASLAAGGEKGSTLAKRLAELGGNVRAKTGTIRGVSGLAGYVRARSGTVYCFAVLVNDPKTPLAKARRLQDDLCLALYEER